MFLYVDGQDSVRVTVCEPQDQNETRRIKTKGIGEVETSRHQGV